MRVCARSVEGRKKTTPQKAKFQSPYRRDMSMDAPHCGVSLDEKRLIFRQSYIGATYFATVEPMASSKGLNTNHRLKV
jgi:hypothetical protein